MKVLALHGLVGCTYLTGWIAFAIADPESETKSSTNPGVVLAVIALAGLLSPFAYSVGPLVYGVTKAHKYRKDRHRGGPYCIGVV